MSIGELLVFVSYNSLHALMISIILAVREIESLEYQHDLIKVLRPYSSFEVVWVTDVVPSFLEVVFRRRRDFAHAGFFFIHHLSNPVLLNTL